MTQISPGEALFGVWCVVTATGSTFGGPLAALVVAVLAAPCCWIVARRWDGWRGTAR